MQQNARNYDALPVTVSLFDLLLRGQSDDFPSDTQKQTKSAAALVVMHLDDLILK